ncbi:TetR family transcriptional regulator C-terminal domain-containing protein, partial [Rhizobiaceae sp. 2RAB30]
YDRVTAEAQSRAELIEGFLDKLGETIRKEAHMHRLWYDLRSQAMFEDAFRQDVAEIDKSLEDMVWRVASRLAELGGRKPAVTSSALYAVFDGLFQKYLLKHLSGDPEAIPELLSEVRRLLPLIA